MFRVAAGLHRRLLVLLLFPLPVLTLFGIWYDYESTDTLSVQLDYKLQRLMPLLVESVFVRGKGDDQAVVVLLAPPIGDFLSGRNGPTAFSIRDMLGNVVAGSDWMSQRVPGTAEPDYYSEEEGGVVYRIAAQKISTSAGDLVLFLADGSDPRQQWLRALVWKVVVPNLMLMGVAVLLVNWAVNRALKPLLDLKDAVEHRSPRDLSPIDPMSSPEEVRPLVQSLNRLFELVNAQTESQRRFVADAAHQLRTPLAGLQAQVEAWAQALVAAASPPPPRGHAMCRTNRRARPMWRPSRSRSRPTRFCACGMPHAAPRNSRTSCWPCRAPMPATPTPPAASTPTCRTCAKPCWKPTWTMPPSGTSTWAWTPNPPMCWGMTGCCGSC